MIILEDLKAALLLNLMVPALGPPPHHRFLVAPRRVRQQPAGLDLALEPLVVDEAVDRAQDRLQPHRELQILLVAFRLAFDFEDHGKHRSLLCHAISMISGGPWPAMMSG